VTDADLELLVRRTLVYVARGCDRMAALATTPKAGGHAKSKQSAAAPSYNCVFNYLPPGFKRLFVTQSDRYVVNFVSYNTF
jgi:hypothetical protein